LLERIDKVAVVGGGTSGWFAAAYIKNNLKVDVTLIDKEVGAPVGVGEGTLLNFDRFLNSCGFTTDEWFDEVDATFKSGILFPKWAGKNHIVWHPFYTNPQTPGRKGSLYEGYTHAKDKIDFHYMSAFYDTSIRNNVDEANLCYYAMHVDCGKVVKFLQERCAEQMTLIKSEVVEVSRDTEGYVSKLTCKDGTEVEADLFIDCTGFLQLLQDNPENVDLTDRLFVDTAVAGHVPYEDVERERHPYVISEANEYGWTWNIPVRSRIGSGMVFNRGITDIDEAKEWFCNYWDNRITPDDLKVIDWTPYYTKKFWDKNVIAIGLSGGFIEPLESTGISMIITGITELGERIQTNCYTDLDIEFYNVVMKNFYEYTIDFVSMHYGYSKFQSPFWDHVRDKFNKSQHHLFYEEMLEEGRNLNSNGKGFFLGGANWLCWLLQLNDSIATPCKQITEDEAKMILLDWQRQLSNSRQSPQIVSHTDALERANDIFENMRINYSERGNEF